MTISATITLPGKLDSLYSLISFVSSFAHEHGFSGGKISHIELGLEEILVNIINHAYKESGIDGAIEITCKFTDNQTIIIEIKDSGKPFDIFSVHEPDLNAGIEDRQIGGLGIFLVKQLMDEVRYSREQDRNKLTFVVHNSG